MTLYAPHSRGSSLRLIARRTCTVRNLLVSSAASVGAFLLLSGHPEQGFAAFTSGELEAEHSKPRVLAASLSAPMAALSPTPGLALAPAAMKSASTHAGHAVPESVAEPPRVRTELPQIELRKDLEAVAAPGAGAPQRVGDRFAMLTEPNFARDTGGDMFRFRMPDSAPVAILPRVPETAPEDTGVLELGPVETLRVERFHGFSGEDLAALLERQKVREDDIHATLVALRADDIPATLSEGDVVDLAIETRRPGAAENRLVAMRLKLVGGREVELRWDGSVQDLWTVVDAQPVVTEQVGEAFRPVSLTEALGSDSRLMGGHDRVLVRGEVGSTLYEAALDSGMTPGEAETLSSIFRYLIDFERDIRKGDSFEVLFEKKPNGDYGEILYAAIDNRGTQLSLFRGRDGEGIWGYYDAEGKTNKRALMRTPVASARISSKFGMRMHPIQGYRKMHRGVDFAAPTGTPVLAAGDGVVEYVGHRGTYGKYIRIRHRNGFKTAYAHLSRYASNLRTGMRVKQGEIIGNVGSTGRSTGPHLHFEVLKQGERINPMQVGDFGQLEGLSGTALAEFRANIARVELVLSELRPAARVAQATTTGN